MAPSYANSRSWQSNAKSVSSWNSIVVAAACAALVAVVAALAVFAKRRRTPPLEPAVAHPTKEAPAGQMA